MSLTDISTQEAIYFLETIQDEVENEPQYDSFTEKLVDTLNEKELGMCLFKLNKCTCCLKHTSQDPGFINNCECKCRHFRRWLYRALATYSGDQLVIQKHNSVEVDCCNLYDVEQPGAYQQKSEQSADYLPDYEDVVDEYRDTHLNIDNLKYGYWV